MSGAPNKKTKLRSAEVDTALHVIKGAAVKVLHTPLTTSVEFRSKTQGRILVQYESDTAPTPQQINEIQALANQKIKENVHV
jgi:Ser-tRNA(Ala) deacylase AlaX